MRDIDLRDHRFNLKAIQNPNPSAMKLLSIFCFLSLTAGGLQAQIALDSGLVAHWELDDNVLDSSPNFHNGTAVGPTAIDDRFGNSSSAYAFNGTTDYVSLPTLWATPPDAVIFSCWFRSTTTNPQGKLILHGRVRLCRSTVRGDRM